MGRKLTLVLILLLICHWGVAYGIEEDFESSYERAKILEVLPGEEKAENFLRSEYVTLEILTGELKGIVVTIEHMLTDTYGYDLPVKAGDRVLVIVDKFIEGEDVSYEVHITEYVRDIYVYGVVGIFVVLLFLVGGKSGFKTLISLVVTLLLILKVLIPGMLKGYEPVLLTILCASAATLITILMVGGFNIKSYAAIIGVLGGVLAAGLITYYVGTQVQLTGLDGDEVGMLMYLPQNISFDFRALLFAGIMLGSMGAVMDVGISIASAMEEVKRANPAIGYREWFMSGMNVGRDMMGTMSNTLILAYVGGTIPLLLVFMAYETSFTKIINLDIIASEIIRAFAGTIGLILTIPLTALATTFLTSRREQRGGVMEKEKEGI